MSRASTPHLSLLSLTGTVINHSMAPKLQSLGQNADVESLAESGSSPEHSPTSVLESTDPKSTKCSLNNTVLKSLGSHFACGDPRLAWDQPARLSSFQTLTPSEREKCALMEVFFLLSPLSNPDMKGLSQAITQLIVDELNAAVRAKICTQDYTPEGSSLRLCLAVLHEYASGTAECLADPGCPALWTIARNFQVGKDLLIESAREWLEVAGHVRRPGPQAPKNFSVTCSILLMASMIMVLVLHRSHSIYRNCTATQYISWVCFCFKIHYPINQYLGQSLIYIPWDYGSTCQSWAPQRLESTQSWSFHVNNRASVYNF